MYSLNRVKQLGLLVATIGFIILVFFYSKRQAIINEMHAKPEGYQKHHVFIDLGVNVGDSVRYFFSHTINPFGETVMQGYGLKDDIQWIVYAVEPNPAFNSNLDELKVYEHMGHKINLYKQTAAWIENGQMDFYIDISRPGNLQVGSSLLRNHPNVIDSNFTSVKVTTFDLSELLSKYTIYDEIILKIDVEGAEYKLLDHLIKKNTLKFVDIIAVEFHNYLESETKIKNPERYYKKQFNKFNIRFVSWS